MVLGLLYHGLKDIIRDDLVIVHDDIIEFLNAVVKVTLVLDNKVVFFGPRVPGVEPCKVG